MNPKIWVDCNGELLSVGDHVRFQYCSGRYGQTAQATGTIRSFSGGWISVDLDDGQRVYSGNTIRDGSCSYWGTSGGDHPEYGRVLYTRDEHIDFEHGHKKWMEKIK